MTPKVHHFDLRVSGGYEMSLFYPDSEKEIKGKTANKKDKFAARFIELISNEKVVQAINCDSTNPDFKGEMIMETTLEPVATGI